MAWALVQNPTPATGSGTSINKAFSSNVTAGNAVVACATVDANTTCTFSSSGDSWTTLGTFFETAAGQLIAIGIALNVTGGAKTVTATYGATGNFDTLIIGELSGGPTTLTQDGSTAGRHNAASSTPTDAALVTTLDGDLILSGLMLDSLGTTITAGGSFTLIGTDTTNGLNFEFFSQSTHGSISASFNSTASVATGIRTFAVAAGSGAASVPWNPQRSTPVRDYGEVQWLQKDRRNANLVATAANDLDVPLLLPEVRPEVYTLASWQDRRMVPQQPDRHLRALDATAANDLAVPQFQPVDALYWHIYNDSALQSRRLAGQQRVYYDPSQLQAAVAMPAPPPQRTVQTRDTGEVQWLQEPRRDPSLLTTALLENELLGGAETGKRTNLPATHVARWWMPQQPQREGYSPGLLDTALLETPLLGAADDLARHRMWFTDRREVPQQRQYYDLSLLLTALLESPLLWLRPPQYLTDRRVTIQMPRLSDPALLGPPTDPITLIGVGGDLWRRYNTPATHADRRQTVRERPRWTIYVDVDTGHGSNVPIVSTTPAGTYVSQTGTGSTQQTAAVAIVSEGGVVIVSQTLGGVL